MDWRADLAMGTALVLAWAWDQAWGEFPAVVHPVAWLGRLLVPLGTMLSRLPPAAAFAAGALSWTLLALALGLGAQAAQALLAPLDWPWRALILAILLKPCFAWRMLRDEVRAVGAALRCGLGAGRMRVARLVSRDVSALDAAQVTESAIETLAENLNDSVVAPLFWFAVAGLPGAVVYRFANTADASWGYRGRYEWAGKWAARADDVLSWLPARLSAALLLPILPARNWLRLRREAAGTPSPNGGWPMGAMALRLGVRLRKPGVYALNAAAPSPSAMDLAGALRHAAAAAWTAAGTTLLAFVVPAAWGWSR
jgi:adenosylcobinamide-phosphate synthase